jgi:CRISPR-associated protein Csb3
MNHPEPSIRVTVDPTNPGQFFACCGLLELADRLWPGAEGWFAEEGREFMISCQGTLRELLAKLIAAKLETSLSDEGMKRLGSLLSAAKTSLTKKDEADKERLRAIWQRERVTLTAPFNLSFDWWWDKGSGMNALKTWAAKQFVLEIARPLLAAVGQVNWTDEYPSPCLTTTAKLSGLPFYFDAANNAQNTPRDFGVAPSAMKQAPSDRPLLELLAYFGLQRFRPHRSPKSEVMRYSAWSIPLAPAAAGATVSGALELPDESRYEFQMLKRTEYMKAVLQAKPAKEIDR